MAEGLTILGDAITTVRTLPDKSVDLTLTDIPYGEVNRKSNGLRNLDRGCADIVDFNLEDLLKELVRVTRGSIYIFCGTEQVSRIREYLVASKMSTRLIIWEKTNPSPMNGDRIWLSGIECCVYGKFKGSTFNAHCKNTVLRYPVVQGKKRIHPTQKPLELFKYLIEVSSNPGDIVLDPFAGSGTTVIACKELDRDYICIEKDYDTYYDMKERINNNE